MKKSEIFVTVKLGDILDSGHWDDFCIKYGINEWCINEGLADTDDTEQISLMDVENYGLINEKENDIE